MIRINLLPPEERASLKIIQAKTWLLVTGLCLCSLMIFASVYLRLQIKWEKDEIEGYQETMASMGQYRVATAQLEKNIKTLQDKLAPLETQMKEIVAPFDVVRLLATVAQGAERGNVWLQDLTLQKAGVVAINGFAVDFAELNHFTSAMGADAFRVQMGSESWDVRGGVRLVIFSAQVGNATAATATTAKTGSATTGGKNP